MPRPRILANIGRFSLLPRERQRLFLEATMQLMLAQISLAFIPFSSIARKLGSFESAGYREQADTSEDQRQVVAEIGRAVSRAARHLPSHPVCLPQALAARRMLWRRGIGSVLRLGVGKEPSEIGGLKMHAWLDSSGVEVTGYPVTQEVVEVAAFVTGIRAN